MYKNDILTSIINSSYVKNKVGANSLGVQANIKGAIAYTEGNILASETINDAFVVVDAGIPNAWIRANQQRKTKTNAHNLALISSGINPLVRNGITLDPQDAPDRYDGNPIWVSPLRKAGAKAVIVYPSQAIVRIPNYESGYLFVKDEVFTITDRGAFVELKPGQYTGKLDDDRQVKFEIPKGTSDNIPEVVAEVIFRQ
jgi:hypothetical protein